MSMADFVEQRGPDVLLRLKVVPGASRSQVAGLLGDRLKVRVAAPPEAGKANAAVLALLANALGVKASSLSIESGGTNPEKVVRVTGADAASVRGRLVKG